MSVLSSKRQVTLPKSICERLVIAPGDEIDVLEYNGRITLMKRQAGRSAGALRSLKADSRYSESQSRDSELQARRKR